MSLTLTQIRAKILKATGTDVTDWDNGDTDLDLYANLSWWDIMDKYDFREKEASIIFDTVAGTTSYDVTTVVTPIIFDALQTISIQDPITFEHTDLDLITIQDYESRIVNDTTFQAKPTNYFRRDNSIVLWPTPDQIYQIQLYYLSVLSDIPSGGPVIPQAWHEVIIQGAVWRAFADLGDVVKTKFWLGLQASSINDRTPVKVKELTDTRLAGVQVPGRDYP